MDELLESGNNIIDSLSQQQKQLHNISIQLNDIEYKQKIANRLLRGMTWRGWFMNLFTREPEQVCNPPFNSINISILPDLISTNEDSLLNSQADKLIEISKTMKEFITETKKQTDDIKILSNRK